MVALSQVGVEAHAPAQPPVPHAPCAQTQGWAVAGGLRVAGGAGERQIATERAAAPAGLPRRGHTLHMQRAGRRARPGLTAQSGQEMHWLGQICLLSEATLAKLKAVQQCAPEQPGGWGRGARWGGAPVSCTAARRGRRAAEWRARARQFTLWARTPGASQQASPARIWRQGGGGVAGRAARRRCALAREARLQGRLLQPVEGRGDVWREGQV